MDPILGLMVVMLFLKMVAEDGYSAVSGKPNPRLVRRAARQRSRSHNRVWSAFVDYLGDVAEDAREEAARSRRRRREASREQEVEDPDRGGADDPGRINPPPATEPNREEQPVGQSQVDIEEENRIAAERDPFVPIDPRTRSNTAPRDDVSGEVDIPLDDPEEDPGGTETAGAGSEASSPAADPAPAESNVIRFPNRSTNNGGNAMSTATGEITGLDPAIAYARAIAAESGRHATAGNEGYIGFLAQSKVQGAALQSAYDMQAAFAAASAAAEKHAAELERQKAIQEQYNANPDAGDKGFMQNGQ